MNTSGRSPMTEIRVTPLREEQIQAAVDLALAQDARQRALDPRLGTVRTRGDLEAALAERLSIGEPPLVALDAAGHVRGYALPGVWELAETSILRAFLSARNGVARHLALPDPKEADARAAAAALLAALSASWRGSETTGDLVRWPSADPWLEPSLAEHGFRLDSICALHPPEPHVLSGRPPKPSLQVREALPEDEEALVRLLEEELRYHERYTPFVRSGPAVLQAFRRKLVHRWAGAQLSEGAPLLVVVEQGHEIVAMAENTLLDASRDDEPGFTPPGRYGCIDNVSVREELRGQGIGHLLVQAIFDAFAATSLPLDGYILWYNPDNPQAGQFWPRLGFVPLWTTYQRLHAPASGSRGGP
jgi:GNAT superfamily N-acetyltransferase